MRKFKVFIASVLTYFMAMSILPVGFLQTIANASENDYKVLVKTDYYLRSLQQYGNKFLVASSNAKEDEVFISIIENGNEKVLKKVSEYSSAIIFKKNDDLAIIKYENTFDSGIINKYEKYSFNNNSFSESNESEWEQPVIEDIYLRGKSINEDSEVRSLIAKISKENNLEISIENMNKVEGLYDSTYRDNENQVFANIYQFPSKGNIIEYEIGYGKIGDGYKVVKGIIFKDYIYKAQTFMDRMSYIEFTYDRVNDTAFVYDEIEYNYENKISKYKVTELKNNKVIRESTLEKKHSEYIQESFIQNDKLYINLGEKLNEYSLYNGKYELENSTTLYSYPQSINKFDNAYYYLESVDSNIYLSKFKDNKSMKLVEIKEEIDKYFDARIIAYDEDNILIDKYRSFIIIQKENNSSNSEAPSEDTVTVPTIKPNDKNEIVVSTEEEAKNVEVVVSDIEAIKEGTGSLNIAINNDVEMNLPLSIIDKNLLDGAKNVSVKLNIEEDSEITKDLKAVNKVFDFNLVVNKENEAFKVHNFSEGVAEITFALTDEDLKGLNRDNLVVYYYNEETKKFEAMETKVEGNNVTFTTSHFSKYIISEKIVDKDTTTPDKDEDTTIEPDTDKDTTTKPDADKNEEVVIKPDTDNTDDSTTNSEEITTEAGKGDLPETGSAVSNNVVLVLALGTVLVGSAMFFRRKRSA